MVGVYECEVDVDGKEVLNFKSSYNDPHVHLSKKSGIHPYGNTVEGT